MRYLMRQKLFSLGYNFAIQNELGEKVYIIAGRLFSIGDKLSLQDVRGNELAFIRQQVLRQEKTYLIDYNGGCVTVKQDLFTPAKCKLFRIDVPGPDDLEAHGDLTGHEYQIMRGEQIVAAISKKWLAMSETFGVEIVDVEDPVLMLASTVVLDMCSHVYGAAAR